MAERVIWDHEAVGSRPTTQTIGVNTPSDLAPAFYGRRGICFNRRERFLNKRIWSIVGCIAIVALLLSIGVIREKREKNRIYNDAINLYQMEKFAEAADIFSNLGLYKDSFSYLISSRSYIKYNEGIDFYNHGQFTEAIESFSVLGDFEDSREKVKESKYGYALELYNEGELGKAFSIFYELGDYRDSEIFSSNIIAAM